MRAVIQRVKRASVSVDGEVVGKIDRGLLILLGIGRGDTPEQAERLWTKIAKLRIFPDGEKPTGASVLDVDGGVLVVSQFTLYADCKKGNRPSFINAGEPETSCELCERFLEYARHSIPDVQSGVFGADMAVELVNDGPFTICLDTDELFSGR